MRTLLRFFQKYSNFLLFLFLETVAIILIVQDSQFQKSKIIGLNRQVTGAIYSKVDGAREYLSLKESNHQLAQENLELRNRLDRLGLQMDSSIVRSGFSEPYHYQYVPGRVIRNSVFKQYNYITLDREKSMAYSGIWGLFPNRAWWGS